MTHYCKWKQKCDIAEDETGVDKTVIDKLGINCVTECKSK